MSISRFVPPVEYLRAASRASLQSFELARLNHAANLRREIAALMDQWIQETSDAALARWMMDHHESLSEKPASTAEPFSCFPEFPADPVPDSPKSASDAVLAPPRLCSGRRQESSTLGRKAAI